MLANLKYFTVLLALMVILTAPATSLLEDLDSDETELTLEELEEMIHVGQETSSEDLESYIIEIKPEKYEEEMIETLGGEIVHEFDSIDALAVKLPEQTIEQVEKLDFIENIEEDPVVEVEPPTTDMRQEFEDDSEQVEDVEGDNVRIAVLDTGIDNDHSDFEGRIIDNRDFTGDGYHDEDGHGTHVAGIAAGDGEYPGVAPEASLKNIKVLNDDGEGRLSDAIAGLDYAIDKEVDVAVLSLGAETEECDGSDMLSRTVDDAVEKGVAVTVAAGNMGSESQTITIPGCSRDGFTVGATNYEDDGVAGFSSRGETADGRVKPDVVAPGTGIMAAETSTNGYTMKSGTSMAAPYVAGAFALMIEENHEVQPQEKFEALTKTAIDLGEPETAQGKGRVNITAGIESISSSETDGEETTEEETTEEEHEETENETTTEESEKRTEDEQENETQEQKETGAEIKPATILERIIEAIKQLINR